jgi:hypothetical protein
MGDFTIPATSLAAYRGAIHGAGDLLREGFWMWALILTEDVKLGWGRVLPRGTDGMCLFPIDRNAMPPEFPYQTAIPFLAYTDSSPAKPWKTWGPVPYESVAVIDDGLPPGPMRPWSHLTPTETTAVLATVRSQGAVMVANLDATSKDLGVCGRSAGADLVQEPDGEVYVQITWAGEGGPGKVRFPVRDTWVDFGSDFAFLWRGDLLAMLANRELTRIATANGPRTNGDEATTQDSMSAKSLIQAFMRHWRQPSKTAQDAIFHLFNPIQRGAF